jgi:hypothetical protein
VWRYPGLRPREWPCVHVGHRQKFLGNKLLAATTDRAEGAKKAASAVLRGLETVFEAFGHKSPVTSLGGQRETHILGDTFYSQVPLLWGPYLAKVSVAPVSPELRALTDAPISVKGKPNGIREAVVNFFRRKGQNGSFAYSFVPTSQLCQSGRHPLAIARCISADNARLGCGAS